MSGTISRMRSSIVVPRVGGTGFVTLLLALVVCPAQGGDPSRPDTCIVEEWPVSSIY